MQPANHDFTIMRGGTYQATWDCDIATSATGWSAEIDCSETPSESSQRYLVLSTGTGELSLTDDGTKIIMGIVISATQTGDLTFSKAHYRWKLMGPGGFVCFPLRGYVTLERP